MNKQKVKDINDDLQDILDRSKIAIDIISGIIATASGFVTEQLIENTLTMSGNPMVDIPLKVGKWGLSLFVGDKVFEATRDGINEGVEFTIDIQKEVLKAMGVDTGDGVWVDCTVEDVD